MISKCERCGDLQISEGHVVKSCVNPDCSAEERFIVPDGFLSFYMTEGAIVRWDSEKNGKFTFDLGCRKIWTDMIAQAWADVESGLTRWIDLGFDRYVRSVVPEEVGGLEWYTNTHNHTKLDDEDVAKRFSEFGLWGLPHSGPRSCPSSDMIGIYCVKSNLPNIHN